MSNKHIIQEARITARLEDWDRRRAAHVARTKELNEEFRRLVDEAREANVPMTKVAKVLGWNRQAVYARLNRQS